VRVRYSGAVSQEPATCPRCGADRGPGPECPRCGVIYARARPRPAPPPSPAEAAGPAEGRPAAWPGDGDDARRERLVRTVAPPAALLLAWALTSAPALHALVRTFLSMWVHEAGHAVTAWLCGFGAFPGPWRTLVSATRQPLLVAVLGAGLVGLAVWGRRRRRPALVAAGLAGLSAQAVCTLLPADSARALITFGGDAGCMVLGAGLIATLWAAPDGPLGRGGLRWGLAAIGACALVDALRTWLSGWHDHGQLPLGEIEGTGLSDASTLWQVHGWSLDGIAGRYVALGTACLAALAAGWLWILLRGRARATAAAGADRGP